MTKLIALLLVLLMAMGCSRYDGRDDTTPAPVETGRKLTDAVFLESLRRTDPKTAAFADGDFLSFVREKYGAAAYRGIYLALRCGLYTPEIWHARTGKTSLVLYDEYSGALDPASPSYRPDIRVLDAAGDKTTICVVGDVSFADNYEIMPVLKERGRGLEGVLSEDVISTLRSADVLLVNSEFAFTTRGTPTPKKLYTFRGDPENVKYLLEMGTDIVTLANNHVYDYGEAGFADTLETFRKAGIPYIGAGENIEEASKPFYFILNGRKYAFTAATRAEKNILTPEATENSSGVLRMYDMAAYLDVIREAEAQSDFNIAYVHWGTEKSHATEDGLYENAVSMIDSGADAVIGAHAHVLQGIDYYRGVPIFYNLGNFIFDELPLETAILRLTFSRSGQLSAQMIPCMQEDKYTRILEGNEAGRVLSLLRRLSPNVSIGSDGEVSPAA